MKRVLAIAAALACGLAGAQPDWSKVEIATTRVAEGIYVLQGAGGNIGLSVGEDAVFMIDDQYAPLTARIVEAIARITPKPVRFVLNTHWHGDHTGGNETLGRAGAVIMAHENVRKRMTTEQFLAHLGRSVPPSAPGALPFVTFTGAMTLHLNGEEIRVVHQPRAHTDGDAMVHFLKADVVHMGDVYWNGMYPVIDTGSGGTVEGMIAACDRVLAAATDRTVIVPGHGRPVSNRAELRAYRDMLSTVLGRVQKLLADGRKLEEVVAAGVTRDFDEKWGKGFVKPDKFAEMVTLNLLGNR